LAILSCLGSWTTASATGSSRGASEEDRSIKVGFVTDAAGLNDNGFNHLIFVGLTRAKDELDIQADVTESASPTDYVPNLTTYATKNYDLVIGVGFSMAQAMGTVSSQFPNIHFALMDSPVIDANGQQVQPPNVETVFFKVQESGALVGVIAGMLENTGRAPTNQNVIGAVGGLSIPPVNSWIAGYKWGARLVDPSVTVLIDYANSFGPPAPCADQANSQISRGADIIFAVAGGCGLGALQAAGQAHVYSIGVDVSQKNADASVIVSALKRMDMATFDVIEALQDDRFQGGVVELGLREGATGYSVDNFPGGSLPSDIRARVKKVERQIESGKLTPPVDPNAVTP
jgi:basic membrane protein A